MTDRLQSRIQGALAPPADLDEQQLQQWLRMRRRVGARHAAWRTGMPAIEELFEDEAHRAKALAGNLATELGDVMRGTAEIEPAALVADDVPAEWGIGCCRDWLGALQEPGARSLSSERAREVYAAILVQLVEREHARAVDFARSQSLESGGRRPGPFARALGRIGERIGRFFEPV